MALVVCSSANATALPTKGAEQGVDMMAANQPLTSEPHALPSSSSLPSVEMRISNTPSALRAKTKTMVVSAATKGGCWNCMPQPSRRPDALSATTTAAMARNRLTVPAV